MIWFVSLFDVIFYIKMKSWAYSLVMDFSF